jgi:hypothetical protein
VSSQDFTNRFEESLNRGMLSVPLPAAEPGNARYRLGASRAGRRQLSRLTLAVAAVSLVMLAGLVGSADAGTGPAMLLDTTMRRVVVIVEHVTTHGLSAPAPAPGASGVQPAGEVDSAPPSGQWSVTAPDPDRASEPVGAHAEPEPVVAPPVAVPQDPAPDPADARPGEN